MFEGCSGTAPSPLLELLTVAIAMASSLRLGSGAVSLQRGPLYFFGSLLVHPSHATRRHGGSCCFRLRLLDDHCFGREEQASDRRGVL